MRLTYVGIPMAVFAPIEINDGQATPVRHTFAPALRSGNLVEWQDRSAGVFAGFNRISLDVRSITKKGGMYRATLKVVAPTLAVTAPQSGTGVQPNPVEAYHTETILQFILPAATNVSARANALAYIKNLLSNQQIVDTVLDLNPPV